MTRHEEQPWTSYVLRRGGVGYRLVPGHAMRRLSSHDVHEVTTALRELEVGPLTGALAESQCANRAIAEATVDRLEEAIVLGTVAVTRCQWGILGSERVDPDDWEDDREAIPLCSLAKDWIEIRLVDEAGDPVPHASYELRLPNGTSITGRLGVEGKVCLEELPPGKCELRLTEEVLPRRRAEATVGRNADGPDHGRS